MPILPTRPTGLTRSALCAGALLALGCAPADSQPKIAEPSSCVADDQCSGSQVCDSGQSRCIWPAAPRGLDVLFLIDNSPSMAPKQHALAVNIPRFIQRIDAAGLDYHVGIATSDVGSDISPGSLWGGNIGKCDTYAGDDGVLQAVACNARSDISSAAKDACRSLCPDSRFVPNDGQNFIWKKGAATNVPSALVPDGMGKLIDVGPQRAFQCIALVGDSGCGIEGQLEGARRALDGHRGDNAGFLRHGTVLAVIFITDEDDCSVQLARRSENNPTTRDCDPKEPDSHDCYNVDFRCLARSIECDETTLLPGVKTGCRERPGNYLEKVDKYHKFLSALRPRNRLLVGGIWTLPAITSGGRFAVVREAGGTSTPFLNRASGAGASCTYAGDPEVFGRAQYRLSSFAKLFGKEPDGSPSAPEVSICDIDAYPRALDELAEAIVRKVGLAPAPDGPPQ